MKNIQNKELFRQRTLSLQFNVSAFPVIKEKFGVSNFYQFSEFVKSEIFGRFPNADQEKSELLCKKITKNYILKNFLVSNDIILFLSNFNTLEAAISNFFNLYFPAHENLRRKIGKVSKSLIAFLIGIKDISDNIMKGFDSNKLTELQIDKLMALNPQIKHSSRHLKDIVMNVLKNSSKFEIIDYARKEEKDYQTVYVKNIETISQESDDEKVLKRKKNRKTTALKCKSQREIKFHLEELSGMLTRSSKKFLK